MVLSHRAMLTRTRLPGTRPSHLSLEEQTLGASVRMVPRAAAEKALGMSTLTSPFPKDSFPLKNWRPQKWGCLCRNTAHMVV